MPKVKSGKKIVKVTSKANNGYIKKQAAGHVCKSACIMKIANLAEPSSFTNSRCQKSHDK